MTAGSIQLRKYVMAREFGHGRFDAAVFAGIRLTEAEMIDRDNERRARPADQLKLRTI